MTFPVLIRNLPSILKDFPGIKLVYLFGSQVKGQIGPLSDFDLGIFDTAEENDYSTQVQFQHALVMLLGTERIDIVILKRAPVELAYHVISTGKLLYQKDTYTRVEFEAQVLGKYGDYLPMLLTYKNLILQGDTHAKRVQRYREALGRTQRTLSPPGTSPRAETR